MDSAGDPTPFRPARLPEEAWKVLELHREVYSRERGWDEGFM